MKWTKRGSVENDMNVQFVVYKYVTEVYEGYTNVVYQSNIVSVQY